LVFENAKEAIVKAFGGDRSVLQTAILTQNSLRLENLLVANSTLYSFRVLDQGTANTTNMEKRITLQDAFVISAIKVCVGLPSSSTDNTFLPDSYANPVKYGANAVPLQAFWNANLNISVNNNIVLPAWDLYRHYNAPETQQTAALGAGSPGDQDSGSSDGWFPMEPNVTLLGNKNSILNIVFQGPGLSSISTNSRAIILLRGVLAQNVTPVS
jgi:hypothetical protein